ncbi:MAG: AmmeMemoRadiSam system radical SAM enzyme [Planctomycetota bacterium]|jgi:pyruvate formate lyase activating enzyme
MEKICRRKLLGWGLACGAALPALDVLELFAQESGKHTIECDPKYYEKLKGRRTRCLVCPLTCTLNEGEFCFCRSRGNVKGRLISFAYNNPCVLTVDPVEKTPLSHYLPGTTSLSLGMGGCNLRCLYCQNWQQSQKEPHKLKTFDVPKEKMAAGAERKECRSIAYTYTEPIAFSEYMRDASAFARKKGLRNICATALFVEKDPLKEYLKNIDAFAVALKGFDETFYDRVLGSVLKPVLDALVVLKEAGKWTEVVTLIVPTYNDDMKKVKEQVKWHRKNLGADTPLHFGRFVPQYKLKDLPRTPVETLEKCRNIALDGGLNYAYIFNVSPHDGNNTYCPKCGAPVIKRLGFKILQNNMKNGACGKCGRKIPGIWS